MSIRVLKQGMHDSVQDLGRYGYQHLGITPGGAMDPLAAAMANSLVGNEAGEAVLELHFPAASFLFNEDAIIALSGANFTALLNETEIPINKPVVVKRFTALTFSKKASGARCYLAIHGGFTLQPWMESYSTNTRAAAGGWKGRALVKGDELPFRKNENRSDLLRNGDVYLLPWQAVMSSFYSASNCIRITEGAEYTQLEAKSMKRLLSSSFTISRKSDRMGYRLEKTTLRLNSATELVTAAVTRGTIQLFPDGQPVVLMADHQTTGGYPRIAHVIAADQPKLAQLSAGDEICFELVEHSAAEELLLKQIQDLRTLNGACAQRLFEYLNAHGNHRSQL